MAENKQQLNPRAERLQADIDALAGMIDGSRPGYTRRPFTPWYRESRAWLAGRMREAGLTTRIDAASNLIGFLPGADPSLKPIAIGSHTDTVNGGGRFDGIIGVLAGIEIARLLKETGTVLRHPLEIIDFTAEEPSEFGISTVGSRGMVGNLTPVMLELVDAATGTTLREAIAGQGGDPDRLAEEARKPGDVALYLELHIEQGPVLERTATRLGVVSGIVGIVRAKATIVGDPNHAGTTPMTLRYDALGAAFERLCRERYEADVVGTIGKISNEPNASNVVPGKVTFELEIRSLDPEVSGRVFRLFEEEAARVGQARGLRVQVDKLSESSAIRVAPDVLSVLADSCAEVGSWRELPSGAGHDANQMAVIAPIGMLFVPSLAGKSHCPEEWTDTDEVADGVRALAGALLRFDERAVLGERG